MEGFVGGSCSRDIVRREALDALRTGVPRMLEIRPAGASEAFASSGVADRVVVPMSCASEGAVEVYLEPHLPPRRLLVAGFTPVAEALARLAAALSYDVTRVVDVQEASDVEAAPGVAVVTVERLPEHLAGAGAGVVAVIASQGHYDEAVLEALSHAPPAFVGLLASRKRAADVRGILAQAGVPAAWLSTIHNPVGLDLGARSPADVAVSILAQVVAEVPAGVTPAISCAPVATLIDPVCGMEVEPADLRHRAHAGGATFAFCSAHCRATFERAPHEYAAVSAS
jgi:xanthine dehydrogenase accessory factor